MPRFIGRVSTVVAAVTDSVHGDAPLVPALVLRYPAPGPISVEYRQDLRLRDLVTFTISLVSWYFSGNFS